MNLRDDLGEALAPENAVCYYCKEPLEEIEYGKTIAYIHPDNDCLLPQDLGIKGKFIIVKAALSILMNGQYGRRSTVTFER